MMAPAPPTPSQQLTFIRYLDHVLYNRNSTVAMKPQIREAVGWLVYDYEVRPLPLQKGFDWNLSRKQPIQEAEYAFRPSKRKTHSEGATTNTRRFE